MNQAAIEAIFDLYERRGGGRYGEGVTQLEHALQCAQLATLETAGDSLIAAALLHDIGHLLEADDAPGGEVDGRHEVRGAAALRGLFGPDVVRPIALHVAAKRYLCATEAGYHENLSEASRRSLRLQGGPLSVRQARRFEGSAYFAAAVRLRRYDEGGKLDGTACKPLRDYGDLLGGLGRLNRQAAGRTNGGACATGAPDRVPRGPADPPMSGRSPWRIATPSEWS